MVCSGHVVVWHSYNDMHGILDCHVQNSIDNQCLKKAIWNLNTTKLSWCDIVLKMMARMSACKLLTCLVLSTGTIIQRLDFARTDEARNGTYGSFQSRIRNLVADTAPQPQPRQHNAYIIYFWKTSDKYLQKVKLRLSCHKKMPQTSKRQRPRSAQRQ